MKKSISQTAFRLFIFIVMLFYSCQKLTGTDHEPIYHDKSKPGAVSNVQVINFSGGAYVVYKVADDPGILYVQADYKINDKISLQAKASYYTDTIKVVGFEKAGDYKVILHAVSRSEVKSDPVEVTVSPLIPPYLIVKNSLEIFPDFGGATIRFKNPAKGEIALIALVDTAGKPEYINTAYSKDSAGIFSVRGFSARERKFGAYIRDRWGNTSDTVWAVIRSMNELELDRTIMKALVLPGDQLACCNSDLNVPLREPYGARDRAFYGVKGATDSFPARVTIDMGRTVIISRLRYWMRANGSAEFRNGTLKYFKLYGSMNPNPNGALDNSWTQIGGVYELVKPSGLPYGQLSPADHETVANGSEFILPLPAIPMRYFRIVIVQNYSGGDALEMASIKFMGDYQ